MSLVSLNQSGLAVSNPALYQTIKELLDFQSQVNAFNIPSIISNQVTETDGFWTPTDASGAGLVITNNFAKWFRTKTMVFAGCNITYPATASGAAAAIGGLPFNSKNFPVSVWAVSIAFQNTAVNPIHIFVNANNDIFSFFTAGVAVTNAQLTAKTLALTAIYPGQ